MAGAGLRREIGDDWWHRDIRRREGAHYLLNLLITLVTASGLTERVTCLTVTAFANDTTVDAECDSGFMAGPA